MECRLVGRRSAREAQFDAVPRESGQDVESESPFLTSSYEVCSYYYLTPTTLHAEASMRSLTETLSSLTVDELPLILPLLQRINQDIAANPTLPSLPRVFIALWTRIASSLHEEQVAALLLTSLSQFLEQSLQAHNFLPLETLCDRATLSSLLQDLGPKQFLKLLLPYMMELLLSNQTPSSIQDHLVTTISFLSSPRLLGPALTTRYLLPTLTVKTGSITFKRSDTMRPWSESTHRFPLPHLQTIRFSPFSALRHAR